MLIVEIRNYKTIEHMQFQFEGFASIQGKNFIGKSAILGAIRSCLTNTMDKESVRTGTDYTEVRLVHDHSGLDCFWHWEEGNTYYLINSEEFLKLNGAVPPPLKERGFSAMEAGEEKIHLWDAKQFNPLFLVDKGRSTFATDILSSIFKIDSVYKAKELCGKEIKDAKASVKTRKADLLKAEGAVMSLRDFDAREEAYKEIELSLDQLTGKVQSAERAKGLLEAKMKADRECGLSQPLQAIEDVSMEDVKKAFALLAKAQDTCNSLQATKSLTALLFPVGKIPTPAGGDAVTESLRALSPLKTLSSKLIEGKQQLMALGTLSSVPPLPDMDSGALSKVLPQCRKHVEDVKAAREVSAVLSGVESLPVLPLITVDVQELDKATRLLLATKAATQLYRSLLPTGSLPPPPECLADLQKQAVLQDLCMRMLDAMAAVSRTSSELAEATRLWEEAVKTLNEIKTCPTCGQALHGDSHATTNS